MRVVAAYSADILVVLLRLVVVMRWLGWMPRMWWGLGAECALKCGCNYRASVYWHLARLSRH
ncbi:hypothetical protein N658DRAFT_308482 [Parathielavia hyrcaniae]|uniref:Uncharacterized protein n=1 Tax=Parathielavia hyrcaniae TaxID=113614 RepID=A0AAN6T413_9PEZI|nr:hypothetical protein N658DRAFT_308482 [Parathielavia hyrcaniae]